MAILKLHFSDFRNISSIELFPCSGINLFYGANGQGKTNLLEGIWLFTGMPSFRGAKLSECVRFERQNAVLELECADTYLQKARLVFGKERGFFYNGVRFSSPRKAAGYFRCVVFSPEHLYLFHDGPKARRNLLDQMISQLRPDYDSYLTDYEKILVNRNALLRDYKNRSDLPLLLEPWDLQLAQIGTWLTVYRMEYVSYLSQYIEKIYDGLSNGAESLRIRYVSTVFEHKLSGYRREDASAYRQALNDRLPLDLEAGFTGIGAHRDDLEFTLNALPIKNYGSQGQQRSAVVALKIAEAELIRKLTGQQPVVLLDDVMSELDVSRQNFILNHLHGQQVFVTCCDPANTLRLKAGKIFHIDAGTLREEREASADVSSPGGSGRGSHG